MRLIYEVEPLHARSHFWNPIHFVRYDRSPRGPSPVLMLLALFSVVKCSYHANDGSNYLGCSLHTINVLTKSLAWESTQEIIAWQVGLSSLTKSNDPESGDGRSRLGGTPVTHGYSPGPPLRNHYSQMSLRPNLQGQQSRLYSATVSALSLPVTNGNLNRLNPRRDEQLMGRLVSVNSYPKLPRYCTAIPAAGNPLNHWRCESNPWSLTAGTSEKNDPLTHKFE